MPPILLEFGRYGIIGLLMVAVVYITIQVIKKIPEKPNKESENFSMLLEKLANSIIASNTENTAAIIAHNNRALEFQQRVQDEHKAMLEQFSAVMQILCVQNQQMVSYDRGMEKIQERLAEICGKVQK